MPAASALSEHPLPTHAIGEAIGQVLDQVGEAPDAVVLFATGPLAGAMEDLAATVRSVLAPRALIGATASGVLGRGREVEGDAAVALFAVSGLPDPPLALHLDAPLRAGDPVIEAIAPGSTVVLVADPFSCPVHERLAELALLRPDVEVVGGLASAAAGPGGNRLVAGSQVVEHGAVALVLPASSHVRTLVSQASDPVGEPLVVTRAAGSMIEEIAGQPALDRLLGQAEAAPVEQRNRMARGLRIGIALDERTEEFGRGDFLVRDVLGADRERRAIRVATDVEVGSTIQFHVFDAASANADLRSTLADAPASAALAFTCNGRGLGLFGTPHHDASILDERLDHGPLAGMFSAGEIGPVGGRNHPHTGAVSLLLVP